MRLVSEQGIAACALAICAVVFALGFIGLAVMGHPIPSELAIPAATVFGGVLNMATGSGTSVRTSITTLKEDASK